MPRYEDTLRVWSVFEEQFNRSLVLSLGISNIYDIDTLRALYDAATVKPSYVQNRFYAKTHYDKEIRRFCLEKGIVYQSFWSLTANKHILKRSASLPLVSLTFLTLSLSLPPSVSYGQWENLFDSRETELHSGSSVLSILNRGRNYSAHWDHLSDPYDRRSRRCRGSQPTHSQRHSIN
jgi:hypothetical protein